MCLQSGSDAVLRRMRRRWSMQSFLDRCRLAWETLDQPAFTTDVIVGFPGETDADFAATCRMIRDVGFSKVHIFPFSPRQGTPAAAMDQQVPPRTKAERCRELAAVEAEQREPLLPQPDRTPPAGAAGIAQQPPAGRIWPERRAATPRSKCQPLPATAAAWSTS